MKRTTLAFALLACVLASGPEARGSVAFTVVFDALVEQSTAAGVVVAAEARSVWESGRIVTYTRLRLDELLAGAAPADVWVRTLGGEVGEIGQQVEGEAVFASGRRYLVFLKPATRGAMSVVARAQGEFPVELGEPRIIARPRAASLPPRADEIARARKRAPSVPDAALPAASVLAGQSVQTARILIRSAWMRTHAPG